MNHRSEIIIQSRCHRAKEGQWCDNPGLPYELNGEYHTITWEEVEDIERSGRSTWSQYASEPSQWPEPTAAFLPLCNARPGATIPGERPVPRTDVVWKFRPLTTVEEAFTRQYRKKASIPMLAAVFHIAPKVIREHCRAKGYIGIPTTRTLMNMGALQKKWTQFGQVA